MHYAPSTRLSLLPFHLQLLVHARLASTTASTSDAGSSSTSYPFPAHPNPTPHQIFHLPHSASQQEVKARCKQPPIFAVPRSMTDTMNRLRPRARTPPRCPRMSCTAPRTTSRPIPGYLLCVRCTPRSYARAGPGAAVRRRVLCGGA